jgi:restriction endonuclease Mrr
VDREFHIAMPDGLKGSSSAGLNMSGDVVSDISSSSKPSTASVKSRTKKEQFDHAMGSFDRLASAVLTEKEAKASAVQAKLQMELLEKDVGFSPTMLSEMRSELLANAGFKFASKKKKRTYEVAKSTYYDDEGVDGAARKRVTASSVATVQQRLAVLQKSVEEKMQPSSDESDDDIYSQTM